MRVQVRLCRPGPIQSLSHLAFAASLACWPRAPMSAPLTTSCLLSITTGKGCCKGEAAVPHLHRLPAWLGPCDTPSCPQLLVASYSLNIQMSSACSPSLAVHPSHRPSHFSLSGWPFLSQGMPPSPCPSCSKAVKDLELLRSSGMPLPARVDVHRPVMRDWLDLGEASPGLPASCERSRVE